ncbi:MAG: DUF5985 family protein [Tahibacter sp.]
MTQFLLGAIAMASAVAGLLFFRFYRRTRDRFFIFFATSFWLDAICRCATAIFQPADEWGATVYTLRVVTYGLILIAILDKNRPYRPH